MTVRDSELLPVVVAGNLVLDMFPPLALPPGQSLRDRLVGGQLVELGALTTAPGGVVSNTGICLHRLGVPVRAMGQIGPDLLGRELRRLLDAAGLDTSTLPEASTNTAYTIVLSPPHTDRIFLHYAGPALTFSVDDIDWDAVAGAGIFHLGYPPLMPALYAHGGAQLVEMMRRAKTLGATTSLDMCMQPPDSESAQQDWQTIMQAALPYVDLLLPSIEELLLYLQPQRYDELSRRADGREVLAVVKPPLFAELADAALDMGAAVVGVKAGRMGMFVRTAGADRLAQMGRVTPGDPANWANRERWEPGYIPQHIVTATGAGDAAVAGFLAAFLRGETVETTLRYSCALGVQNLEAPDATSSIRTWAETTRLMQSWPKNTLALADALPGWRFDAASGQWASPRDAVVEAPEGER